MLYNDVSQARISLFVRSCISTQSEVSLTFMSWNAFSSSWPQVHGTSSIVNYGVEGEKKKDQVITFHDNNNPRNDFNHVLSCL